MKAKRVESEANIDGSAPLRLFASQAASFA